MLLSVHRLRRSPWPYLVLLVLARVWALGIPLVVLVLGGSLCLCFVAADCPLLCVPPSYHISSRGVGGLLAAWYPWARRSCSFAMPCVACASALLGIPLALTVLSGLLCACFASAVWSAVACGSLLSLACVPRNIFLSAALMA